MYRSVRLVIFDMDGTITRPYLDFKRIRAAIDLPEPLLENMMALPPGPPRNRAFGLLEQFEDEAAEASELNDSVIDVLGALGTRDVRTGLVTRNSRRSALRVLGKHGITFSRVVTREDGPVKPRPEPLWMICESLGIPPEESLMVGDFKFDVVAGRAAGMRTALLTNGGATRFLPEAPPDHVLSRLIDLLPLLSD